MRHKVQWRRSRDKSQRVRALLGWRWRAKNGWNGFKTWPEEEKKGGREVEVPPAHPVTPPLENKDRSKRCREQGRQLHAGCAKLRYPEAAKQPHPPDV